MATVRTPTQRVWVLIGVLAGVAVVVFLGAVVPMAPLVRRTTVPWPVLVALFALAEVFVVHLTIRRNAHTLSLNEIPLVVGMAFAAPVALVAARVVGAALALVLHRRQTGTKLLFNLTCFALEACLAVSVYRLLLGSASPVEPRGWIAAFVAVLVGDLVMAAAITGAMALQDGHVDRVLFGRALAVGALALGGNTTLALVAVIALEQNAWSVILLGVVAAILFTSYRAITGLRQGYARLETLYRFTGAVGGSVEARSVTETVLSEARELLGAERAELRLSRDGAHRDTRLVLRGDGTLEELPPLADGAAGRWWRPALRGEGVVLPRAPRDEASRAALAVEEMKDAMAAPLRRESEVIGVLIVGNRLDEVTTFDAEDLKLFEALSNHAGVALENGRLVDVLREEVTVREHQALHDALTELPNRRLFGSQVEGALAAARETGGGAIVLYVDLNRFKEINDTLGHHTGDLLLREVGHRLQAIVPPAGSVGRLGGDEFAVLFPEGADEGSVQDAAAAIRHALSVPFSLGDIDLDVDACIGAALFPRHGDTATELMQRADVALYTAKATRADIEVYEPAQHQGAARRLAMVGELRRAIEQGELELASGRVIGAEALLRWDHPAHGPVGPDEFVTLAEHTGLIRPLTRFVLDRAVRQCASWRRSGIDLGIAVNLSVRSLLDARLPDDVTEALERHQLPAGALTLEITESSIMGDVDRSLAMLESLHGLGVRLSIDDFGTGYSSLTYLKRMSVDEVKIDKSFVLTLGEEVDDSPIVRSTIDLSHNMGLVVVAEGVETAVAWDVLLDLACDLAQGYHMSPAVSADAFEAWMGERRERRWSGRPAPVEPAAPTAQPEGSPGGPGRKAGSQSP